MAYEMGISDWSSDVCSSDLQVIKLAMIAAIARNPVVPIIERGDVDFAEAIVRHSCEYVAGLARDHIADNKTEPEVTKVLAGLRAQGDRQRVGEGTSGSTRVDLGGRRRLKKKKRTTK